MLQQIYQIGQISIPEINSNLTSDLTRFRLDSALAERRNVVILTKLSEYAVKKYFIAVFLS